MFRILRIYRKCSTELLRNKGLRKIKAERFCSSNVPTSTKGDKNELFRYIHSKIKACGPISVAEYMKVTLTHPSLGYYMNKDVFGESGDFTTSPEISQLFGEMVAVWIAHEYKKISKDSFQIVELGPGRGTLMRDILRVLTRINLSDKVSVHLVEVSPTLSAIQAKTLCTETEEVEPKPNGEQQGVTHYRKGKTEHGIEVFWYHKVNDVPKKFSVFVAHEFFDAMPIHKFQRTAEGWREVLVDIQEDSKEEKLRYVLSRSRTPATEIYVPKDEQRSHIEVSPESLAIMDYISLFLYENGGFGLIVDYGHNGEKTDTFRAFHRHEQSDPLLNPGTMDLTADVDFSALSQVASKDNRLITFGPVTQQKFLKRMRIDVRLSRLLTGATREQEKQLISGYKMIMDDDKMGTCFKVLSFFPSVLKDHLNKLPVVGFY